MTEQSDIDASAIVYHLLRVARLSVTEEERERLVRHYPLLLEMMRQLRLPESRYAEPVMIYPAALEGGATLLEPA